jgi:hypothetical protein
MHLSIHSLRRRTPYLALCLTFVLFIAAGALQPVDASHGRFGNIEWRPTENPGEVVFTVRTTWRRNYTASYTKVTGDPAPDWGTFYFGDGASVRGNVNGIITDYSVAGNWIVVENTFIHQYDDPNGTYTAYLSVCCRISSSVLYNRYDLTQRVSARVNPSVASPRSSTPPIVGVLPDEAATFQVFASDPDGAELRYRLATNTEAVGSSNTSERYSEPPNMSIDATTGLVTWDNSELGSDKFWTVQIMVEKLDSSGDVIAHIPIDFLLRITEDAPDYNPPVIATTPASPIVVTIGDLVQFDVDASDPDEADEIEIASVSLPAGVTMSPSLPLSGPASGITSTFSWTPDALGTYFATFVVNDDAGLNSQVTVRIEVIPPCETSSIMQSVAQQSGQPGVITLGISDPEGIAAVDFVDELGSPFLNNLVAANVEAAMESGNKINWLPVSPASPPQSTTFELTQADGRVPQASYYVQVTNQCGAVTLLDPVMEFGASLTRDFALGDNYPNPFSGSTRIEFSVAEAGTVSLQVFDLLGREVQSLVDEQLNAGHHSVTWDGRDASGQSLPSGVYVYRLKVGAQQAARMLTLTR